MTIVLNDRRARYVASAGQTSFDVDFPIDSDADVAVYHKVDLTGVITLLTLTTDYTVTLDGAAPNTADVDLVTGAAVNDIITVEGETSPARDTDFTTGGDFFAGTVNNAEDRQYSIDQESKRDRDRTVVANRVSPDTFDPTLPDVVGEASKFLRLNSAETDFEFSDLVGPPGPPGPGGDMTTKGEDIASSSPLVIGIDGDYFDVTGTTDFSRMIVAANRLFFLQFDGTLTMTHHATNLDLPGERDITTAAGDIGEFFSTGINTIQCVNYVRAKGGDIRGGFVRIGTDTGANQATLNISGLSENYDTYMIIGNDLIPQTDTAGAWLRIGDSGGADAGGADYAWAISQAMIANAAGTGVAAPLYNRDDADAQMKVCKLGGVGNAAGEGLCFVAYLTSIRGTSFPKLSGHNAFVDNSGFISRSGFVGTRLAIITTDRIQFLFSSGNIVSGRITVFAITPLLII